MPPCVMASLQVGGVTSICARLHVQFLPPGSAWIIAAVTDVTDNGDIGDVGAPPDTLSHQRDYVRHILQPTAFSSLIEADPA
eukprot:4490686-Pyramimonas_sp.AAC.1